MNTHSITGTTKHIDYKVHGNDYHDIQDEYGITWIYFHTLMAVAKLSSSTKPIRNARLAEQLKFTPMGVSTAIRVLEEKKLVVNISEHSKDKDWRLTVRGIMLARYLSQCGPIIPRPPK